MIGIIYKFTIVAVVKRDGFKPFYVGQHWEKNSVEEFSSKNSNYWGSGNIWLEYLNNIKKRYPKKWKHLVKREVLYHKENMSQRALDTLEQHFIKKLQSHYSLKLGGCNVLWGTANNFGSGNPMFDKEIAKKAGERVKGKCAGEKCYWYGKKLPDEVKRKISEKAKARLAKHNPNRGRKFSEEAKRNMKIAQSKRDKNTYARGRVITESQRKQISDTLKEYYKTHSSPFKGKTFSDDVKKRIGKLARERWKVKKHPWIGRKHSDESKKKMSESRKQIYERKRAERLSSLL